jgi:hypothetical protein
MFTQKMFNLAVVVLFVGVLFVVSGCGSSYARRGPNLSYENHMRFNLGFGESAGKSAFRDEKGIDNSTRDQMKTPSQRTYQEPMMTSRTKTNVVIKGKSTTSTRTTSGRTSRKVSRKAPKKSQRLARD